MKRHIPFAVAFGLCTGFFASLLIGLISGAITAYIDPNSNSAGGDSLLYLAGLVAVSAMPLLASFVIEIINFFKDLKEGNGMSLKSVNILFIACIVIASAFLLQGIWIYIDMFSIQIISDEFNTAILIFTLLFGVLALAFAGLSIYLGIVKKKTAQE